MKQIMIMNAVNVGLLIIMTIIYIVLGMPLWFVAAYILWLIYMGIVNIYLLHSNSTRSVKSKLLNADHKGYFRTEIDSIISAIDSVEFYKPVFSGYDESSSIRKTYDLLAKKCDNNVQKAVRWMGNYNYASKPSTKYLSDIAENSRYITQKLDELNELVIQVEDSAAETDISYVDDLLKSLKEIVEDE